MPSDNELAAARLKLKEAISNHERSPTKKLNEELQQATDGSKALQDRINKLEGEIKNLTAQHAVETKVAQEAVRKLTIDLAEAKKVGVVLQRKLDVLQKASNEKDATIADLNKQLSWIKSDISKKPEEPKPDPKVRFRRSKSSRIPGLKPGAGPAAGS